MTKSLASTVRPCPHLSYTIGRYDSDSRARSVTHNAGVGSSSLPPATPRKRRNSLIPQWVSWVAALLLSAIRGICATISATTAYQDSPRDAVSLRCQSAAWPWFA